MFIEQYPNEIDLFVFFESKPFYKNNDDMDFAYKFSQHNGLSLIFSFSITSGWIQSIIEYNGKEISQYLIENVNSFYLDNDKEGEYLSAKIINNETITSIQIRIKPDISVKWNTLIR
ncbi:hypothetical protein [Gilliamella sp. ESL0254]|uniref:hypothetical protein n=1 Tax=Gilliamella sp. ESL0254 TaxID=2705035 RepID=UPI00158103E7|nr:hypothetical protein [Gilliamella sp. ESL0254]NUF28301.1 hypothetical protein [Gilliamella sp. ESL0254]